MKEKILFMVDLLEHLDEMHVYIPDIADEVFDLDIDYDDIHKAVEILKDLVEKYVEE